MKFTAYQKHYEGSVVGYSGNFEQYQAVFGYDIDDQGNTYACSFWIFEVEAWDHPSGRNNYLVRDSPGMEWTPYLDETDAIGWGFIKWDGCHEFLIDQMHFCDLATSAAFFRTITAALEKAVEIVYRSRPKDLEDNRDLIFGDR